LKKITKGVKKATKAAYNFAIGDDIKTLKSKNTKWYQKAGAAVSIASNFVPGGGVVSKAAKAVIKGTAKAVTAVKAAKTVTQAAKVVKSPAKKVASVVNVKPKTVPALSIKSSPPVQSKAPAKVSMYTPPAKPKVASPTQSFRGNSSTRSDQNFNQSSFVGNNACVNGKCANPNLGQCPIAGTKILTDTGNKSIEEIKVGEKVLSKNVETGEQGYKEVKQVFVREVDTLYHVKINGTTITNTDEHPYWVVGKGWVEAKDLEKDDQVVLASGEKAAVESVTKEKLDTPVKVYNFEVADWHTYFVAELGVLVHNDCAAKGKGEYSKVGGHHVHAKSAFKDNVNYDSKKGFSISQSFMKDNGLNHQQMTNKQRELFKELNESGRQNSLQEHTRIAVEALIAGGATRQEARDLVAASLKNLRQQGVREPSNIPWYK
jgi:hypothetical protein